MIHLLPPDAVLLALDSIQPGGIGSLESILGSLKVKKFGLRLHSLAESIPRAP
jgi:hypothetical protein